MRNVKLVSLVSASLFLMIAPTNSLKAADATTTVPPNTVGKVATVPKTDDDIAKAIKAEINKDKDFAADAAKVEIKVVNGKVTLTGTVADEDTKDDIETIAKDTAGDNNVVNNIAATDKER